MTFDEWQQDGGKVCAQDVAVARMVWYASQENFARQVREALGEDDNILFPVLNVVADLVRRNNDQAKLLGAFQGKADEWKREAFRAGMERAVELADEMGADLTPKRLEMIVRAEIGEGKA